MKYGIGWHLPTRPRDKDGLYNLQIQIYNLGRQYKCSLNIFVSKEDYQKLTTSITQRNNNLKLIKAKMDEAYNRAVAILETTDIFNFKNFQKVFYSEIKIDKIRFANTLESAFDVLMHDYLNKNKDVRPYKGAFSALSKYAGKDILIDNIDVNWIEQFRIWYTDNKMGSKSTANLYLRCLKVVFNYHIKLGNIPPNKNHFKFIKIQSARKSKEALMPNEIEKFWNFTPNNEAQQKAKDYWFFCYLGNGMNPADMFNLKWSDIKKDRIVFYRRKSTTTELNERAIVVKLSQYLKSIIDRQGDKINIKGINYVFPELNAIKDQTVQEKKKKIYDKRRQYNKILNRIGVKLGLPMKLNFEIARPSFATKLYLDGNKDFAQEMMGHSSATTTDHYYADLPLDRLSQVADTLLDFRPKKSVPQPNEASNRFLPQSEMATITKDGKLVTDSENPQNKLS